MSDAKTLAQRLGSSEWFDRKEVLGALRGEKLPEHLEGKAAVPHGLSEHLEYTRALNARAILSNRIPNLNPAERPEEVPYCIWCPKVASEGTYRKLAKKHPEMRYQVARACAIAGYTELYLELEDVLPEVAVAEEALSAGNTAILDHIMAQPALYRVFDDYFRIINPGGPRVTYLNGDTCVLSMVESQKQAFSRPIDPDDEDAWWLQMVGFKEKMYNITEDQGIAESVPEEPTWSPAQLMADLLTSPLPVHLPAGNKDLLILTAAYYGDIDRYSRLRRPKTLKSEIYCIIRGIYHNSLFALYWERQENPPEGQPFHMDSYDVVHI